MDRATYKQLDRMEMKLDAICEALNIEIDEEGYVIPIEAEDINTGNTQLHNGRRTKEYSQSEEKEP